MVRTLAPVGALLFSGALLLMGNGLQGTLLPVRAQLEFYSALELGVLGSAYFLGFVAGCYFGARVLRRVGHIRTFAAMVSLSSTVVLGHALVLSPFIWWPLRAITGFCIAVLFMVIESWLNEKASNENRGMIFSVYSIINLTVMTIGQMMMTLGSPTAFPLFAVASVLMSLAALPVALTKSAAPAPVEVVRIRILHLYRISPVGAVGAIAVGATNGAFWSLAPVFAQSSISLTGTLAVALFMSIAVPSGALGQWPLGRASDKIDRRRVILVSCVGAAIAGVGLMFFARNWDYGLFILAGLFGFFAFPLYALCIAHMNDHVEPDGFVEASSGLLLLYGGGAVVGPLLASAAMELFGDSGLFAFSVVIYLALIGFTLYRMSCRAAIAEGEQSDFSDSWRLATTVSTVDPLAGEDYSAQEVVESSAEPLPSGASN
jgi:MFS family permease